MIEIFGFELDAFLWFCASGRSFFLGCFLLIAALTASWWAKNVFQKVAVYLFALVAIPLLYLAAIPFTLAFYFVWAVSIVLGLSSLHLKSPVLKKLSLIAIGLTFFALIYELPRSFLPEVPGLTNRTLYVIGDSISAGIGTIEERTWPIIVGEADYTVVDVSQAGATVDSAVRNQLGKIAGETGFVILEIGGNDALMGTPIEEYEEALTKLLTELQSSQRTIIMFEIPVLPWHLEYNRILRRLAAETGVILIPKRFMADIFAAKNSTLDLAHLSPTGHELMAEKVLNLIQPN